MNSPVGIETLPLKAGVSKSWIKVLGMAKRQDTEYEWISGDTNELGNLLESKSQNDRKWVVVDIMDVQ